MNGEVLSDAQIAAMSTEERLALAHRLRPTHQNTPRARESTPLRRIRLWVSAAAALGLIPWIAYLAATLPENYAAHNWRTAWVGFDLLLLVFMLATATLGVLHRHLVMIGVLKAVVGSTAGIAAVLALTLAGCGGRTNPVPSIHASSTTAKISTSTSTAAVTTTTPHPATPTYRILWAPTNERFDKKPTDYVLIDPVDLNNDAFKQNVKLILQDIATKILGGRDPNFSASFFDDEAVAKAELSKQKNPGDLTQGEMDTLYDGEPQHFVARYKGGINLNGEASTGDDGYNISWYPVASTSNPSVGKYKDAEQWKP